MNYLKKVFYVCAIVYTVLITAVCNSTDKKTESAVEGDSTVIHEQPTDHTHTEVKDTMVLQQTDSIAH